MPSIQEETAGESGESGGQKKPDMLHKMRIP
jgi:hypothetical protein